MVDTVYSIGYSGFTINNFINTLRLNKISVVIDVRSQPYSQHFSDYNKGNIEQTLKHSGIHYRNYANEFGARQEERKYYTDEGYLNFELFAKSSPFLSGFNKLVNSMVQDYRFALMCAEKDPINCHRTILVARAFHDAGYKVIHLLPNNMNVTQRDIEVRLLERYFPDRNQVALFGQAFNENEYIAEAYRKRNSEIGYSIEEESK